MRLQLFTTLICLAVLAKRALGMCCWPVEEKKCSQMMIHHMRTYRSNYSDMPGQQYADDPALQRTVQWISLSPVPIHPID